MGKRKVTILEPAAEAVAHVALFIEGKGLPKTAKSLLMRLLIFLKKLADERIEHKPCNYNNVWKYLDYRCVTYKKYVVAFLSQADEIIICDFVTAKLLK